jgi:hypothetical protein
MAVFVRHESCPACGSRDNLGRYDDGSGWCFGCHHVEPPSHLSFTFLEEKKRDVLLDDDLSSDFPGHVVAWLAKYDIGVEEALKHGWQYGKKRDQLVFIFRDEDNNISCTQARNFAPSKNKYFTQGDANHTLPVFYGPVDSGKLVVVVEDVVSAAKVSRQYDSIPCLGSHLSNKKLNLLRLLGYTHMVFWLDADKLKEARALADKAKWLGICTKVVHTELDPKEYNDDEISLSLRAEK